MFSLSVLVAVLVFRVQSRGGHLHRSGRRRRGTRGHTEGSVGAGDLFLSGVDRRVHAPLGTLSNFSTVLASSSVSGRAQQRYGSVVRRGSRLLLGLVGSMVSLSDLSVDGLMFGFGGYSTMIVYHGIVSAMEGMGRARTSIRFIAALRSLPLLASSSHLRRLLVGLLVGTAGFAARNSVALRVQGRSSSATIFSIASANYNVPPRGRNQVFGHFRGLGRNTRNAKLKLSVYRLVIRRVKKEV